MRGFELNVERSETPENIFISFVCKAKLTLSKRSND
jgi:hypothetical protein